MEVKGKKVWREINEENMGEEIKGGGGKEKERKRQIT